MKNVKISVIIPVFNSGKFLEKCLDSVLSQSFKDYEIICINDGSKDKSAQILEKYKKKYPEIQIINQKHKGAGEARNRGLKAATGEYLLFLDSDDFIMPEMLNILYEKIKEKECDIAICNYRRVNGDGSEQIQGREDEYEKFLKTEYFNKNSAPYEVMNCFLTAAWNKLFRAKFIKENNLKFQNIKRANDMLFTKSAMLLADKICCTDEKLIYYRLSPFSLQASNQKCPLEFLNALYALKKFMTENRLYESLKDEFRYYAHSHVNYNLKSLKNNPLAAIRLIRRLKKAAIKDLDLNEDLINFIRVGKLLAKNLIQKLFSVKNDRGKLRKTVTIFGISFHIKRRPKINPKSAQTKTNKTPLPPLMSIIISAYNGEKYLEKCLNSVCRQTLKDIEIICVNDGSKDGTLEILRAYELKDKRIKVINQNNRGLSASRNRALKLASGKYVQFVDCDDTLRFDALESVFKFADKNRLDMVSFGGLNVIKESGESTKKSDDNSGNERVCGNADPGACADESGRTNKTKGLKIEQNPYYSFLYLPKKFNTKCFSWKKCKKFLPKMAVSSCLSAYRLEFIKNNKILFPEGVFFEDNIFYTKAICLAKRCGILRENIYFRLIHKNSITSNKEKYFADYLQIVMKIKELMETLNLPRKVKKRYIKSYVNNAKTRYDKLNKDNKALYESEMNKILHLKNEFKKESKERPKNLLKEGV